MVGIQPALIGRLCVLCVDVFPLLRFGRNRRVMKISKFVSGAAALSGGLMLAPVSALSCNGNGSCENAPGQNKYQGAPGPVVGPACLFLQWVCVICS